jgi:formate-dependent nitrite reductase cytochrome c552 subunit
MSRKIYLLLVSAVVLAVGGGLYYKGAEATPAAPPAAIERVGQPVDVNRCYACHAQIKDFHADGKHATVNCISCHTELDRHLKDMKFRPGTKIAQKACATCHFNQYESFFTMNWKRLARDEKAQPTKKSPNYDLFMVPHGFIREHNMQRSHAFMLIDHLLVERAYGGRFMPKDGWRYLALHGDLKAWDVLYDAFPGAPHGRSLMHGTGAFANPTCFQCKTQDMILDWAYMGEPVKGATWSRVSNPAEMAKTLNHPANCFTCHDPHSTEPRIVRDALIQALTRPEADTLWHKDPNRTGIRVYEMGMRGFTRKIAKLEKPDSKLMCAQCHVEYIGNPGFSYKTGAPIGMADIRSNYFPMVDVWNIIENYNRIDWREFRHSMTGTALIKYQHPEVETFWNSKHDRAGVSCADCHMPKMKDKKTGVAYTSHWQTNPRHYLQETCLQCHTGWTETQARYVIDSIDTHLKGKARKAEFWLAQLIGKFNEARAAGVKKEVLDEARKKHMQAHTLWEWWTAETSGGFHNIDQAKEALATSKIRSMQGINILQAAIGPATALTPNPIDTPHFIGVGPVR